MGLQLELATFQQDALVREGHGGTVLAFAFDERHAFETKQSSSWPWGHDARPI